MSRFFPRLYDCVMRIAERGRLAEWRRDLVRPAEGRVLEIAAGTGLDFPCYRAGVAVIATDRDLAMLARAGSRAERAAATILLVAADAEALPFRCGSFDTCVVALGLCTIPSPLRALGEVRRVLRPGGTARLLEHVRVERPIAGWLQDALTPIWRRVAGGCRLNERSVETVRRAGLRVDDSLARGRVRRRDYGFGDWRRLRVHSRGRGKRPFATQSFVQTQSRMSGGSSK
jgi:ubiquinone/menaquinone biosynthesis C-methylase UbiE